MRYLILALLLLPTLVFADDCGKCLDKCKSDVKCQKACASVCPGGDKILTCITSDEIVSPTGKLTCEEGGKSYESTLKDIYAKGFSLIQVVPDQGKLIYYLEKK
jgi:hypothetical protein